MKKNIFITWHYTTHGIAYLKHILSAFYQYGPKDIYLQKEISQEKMNQVFDNDNREIGEKFVFDKIYYLTANQKIFDKLTNRRFYNIENIVNNDPFIKNDKTLFKIWKDLIEIKQESLKHNKSFPSLEDDIKFVEKQYPKEYKKWEQSLWHNIHYSTVEDQILWFAKYSNAKTIYKSGEIFLRENIDITDFRNALEISKKITPFIQKLKQKHPNANFIINASLGSNETQVVWQVLSELNILPDNTTLIQTYDNKEKREKRFKPIIIKKIPNKIVSEISKTLPLYNEKNSESRKLAELKMQYYIKSGFAILLLGKRGIGKTKLAEKIAQKKQNIISENCASFTDNQIAESILFGHKKGSFTGAIEDKKGAFLEAENGILFLDEIHHLDKLMQAKLMKALQTDDDNHFTIKPVGGNEEDEKKIKLTIILASNNSISELRQKLLPDFYDRVTQLVIELPPLRETREDLQNEFENTWKKTMKFDKAKYDKYVKKDKKLMRWIESLDLYGNYRDLQKIAIYYKTFLEFDEEIKKMLKQKKAFEFTKSEFEKYISINQFENKEFEFPIDKSAEEIINRFKGRLANWAINKFKGAPNAAAHFKEKGGRTTAPTLYNWSKLQTE